MSRYSVLCSGITREEMVEFLELKEEGWYPAFFLGSEEHVSVEVFDVETSQTFRGAEALYMLRKGIAEVPKRMKEDLDKLLSDKLYLNEQDRNKLTFPTKNILTNLIPTIITHLL